MRKMGAARTDATRGLRGIGNGEGVIVRNNLQLDIRELGSPERLDVGGR